MTNPRHIASDLVNAQQARRALDYLVGFNLSPVLWRKVAARPVGRPRAVAGAAHDRASARRRSKRFKAREYWSVEAECAHPQQAFTARLIKLRRPEVRAVHDHRRARRPKPRARADRGRRRRAARHRRRQQGTPAPPGAAVHHLDAAAGSGAQARLRAQRGRCASRSSCTKASTFGDEGAVGLITLHAYRLGEPANDAVARSATSSSATSAHEALPEQPRVYKTKSKNAQEAHEAIRPTSRCDHAGTARRQDRSPTSSSSTA